VITLTCRRHAEVLVVVLRGELDLAAVPALQHEPADWEPDLTRLVLDLERLEFMDVAGLRALLAFHDRAGRHRDEVRVTRGSHAVQRLLALTKTHDRFCWVDEAASSASALAHHTTGSQEPGGHRHVRISTERRHERRRGGRARRRRP